MAKHTKSLAGVTLLEIMLVLAIASMVIVMSIRYYQNATSSENANIIMEEIQNIAVAADNLAQGSGTYSNVSSVPTVAGSVNMKTPFNSSIVVSSVSSNSYSVVVNTIPASVCVQLNSKLSRYPKFSSHSCSGATGNVNLTYTYISNS